MDSTKEIQLGRIGEVSYFGKTYCTVIIIRTNALKLYPVRTEVHL